MIKTIFDFFLLLLVSPIFLPTIITVSIISFINFKGAIFFTQKRIGLNGKPFMIYKFKTMNNDRDLNGNLLPDHLRTTKWGSFLRSSSLDELPSILNIFLLQMSWVGPRPLPEKYRHRFSTTQFKRHLVKPGLTGLAQVNGRNCISWDKKFEYDLIYANSYSLKLDFFILLKTITIVLKRSNINPKNSHSMPEFTGNKKDV